MTYSVAIALYLSLMRKLVYILHMRKQRQISFEVTAKLISAFVFAKRIVHFLYFLNPKFQASSQLLCLYISVCVGPVRKPQCWFSHEMAYLTGLSDTIKSVRSNRSDTNRMIYASVFAYAECGFSHDVTHIRLHLT